MERKGDHISEDKDGNPVFLADSAWGLQMAKEQYPKIEFNFTSEGNFGAKR